MSGARLTRRRALAWGCAHCAGWSVGAALAQNQAPTAAPPIDDNWPLPPRLTRPDLAGDEGGLWALVEREEVRLRRSSFLIKDAPLREYLTTLVCRLGGEHCADTRVYPLRTPWFNASMAPNGMMQVWSGLLLRADNEAQLAAVLGHEIGHYLQRHSLARLRDAKNRSALMSLMVPLGALGLVGQVAALAGGAAYSRDHEREADRIGIVLMRRAGYDTREAARIWENLRAELSAGAGGDPAKKSVMFASHPATDERHATLAQLAGAGGGLTNDAEYQARLEPVMADLLDDELRRAQYDETLALMTRLGTRRPERGDLRFTRGEAYRLRAHDGDLALARADFEAALGLQAPPAATHRSLGLVLRQQGQKAEAAAAFSHYIEQAPQAADAALIRSYIDELKS